MKIFITALATMAIGISIGWYVGYTRGGIERDRYVREKTYQIEHEYSATINIIVTDVIPSIETGNTNKAIQRLSIPIADYYSVFAVQPNPDKSLSRLRDQIDRLARSNRIVAAGIRASPNYESFKSKLPPNWPNALEPTPTAP
jgi:hypothetical protein